MNQLDGFMHTFIKFDIKILTGSFTTASVFIRDSLLPEKR